jgi:hypothetical protein
MSFVDVRSILVRPGGEAAHGAPYQHRAHTPGPNKAGHGGPKAMIFKKHDNERNGTARTRRLALAVVAVLSALGALAPGAASAGTYHMYNCRVPGKETGTKGPWTFTANAYGTSNLVPYDECAVNGGSFGNYLPGGPMGGNSQSKLVLSKDNHRLSITAMKTWVNIDHATSVPYNSPALAALWVDGAKVSEWDGSKQYDYIGASGLAISPTPTQRVELSTTCPPGSGCQIYANPYKVYGVDTTLSESVAPGANAAGPLTAAGAKTGTVPLQVAATDEDSGVRTIEALLDDQVVGSVDYDRDWTKPLNEQKAGTCTYDSWNACPTSQAATFNVNTQPLPDGTYALTARVTDAAGNATTTAPHAVVIDNVPDSVPPVVVGLPGRDGKTGPNGVNGATGAAGATTILTRNGTNASAHAALKARFVGFSSSAIRAAYGKKVQLTGQLLAPGGAPIAGAKVSVLTQDKSIGATMRPVGEVRTDAQGRFIYTMVAKRSQTVRFGYRANLEDVDFAKTIDFRLGVVPKVAFKTDRRSLRNGQSVRFSGAIAGAPATAKKVVELQVRKGGSWMTFATSRLKKGRFSYAYRFKRTHGRVTYVFRARVREEAGFPFLSGHSKTRKVTVRG